MENKEGNNNLFNIDKKLVLLLMTLAFLIAISIHIFLRFYNRYNNEILYDERLNQMSEVTEQLFSGLEDIVDIQWDNALYQRNYLVKNQPKTLDELSSLMREQNDLANLDRKQSTLMAVDTNGRFYTSSGRQGLLIDMSYFDDNSERVSYVFNPMTTSTSNMLFLYRIDEPLLIRDGEEYIELIYYGVSENMEQLNPYFDCEAYDNHNSTYVLDINGIKLFTGNGDKDLLKGFNVFANLRDLDYSHTSTFDDTLNELQEKGLAYSNFILDGEEYYYALYKMDYAKWVLTFIVPSSYVAINTVKIINNTTKLLLVFGVFLAALCATFIYIVLKKQQRSALKIVNDVNSVLEANNSKLELAQNETIKALETANAANRAKTEFLSNMSHDIRTPMNAIVGITKLMAHNKNDPVKIDAYIKKVQQSSQHLLSLINDILDMSKIESNGVVLNKEPISLAGLLWQVESIMRPQIEESHQNFEIHIHNITHEYLIGDALRLRQVLLNLLSNATKYTPRYGHISLDLEEIPLETFDHTKLCITVKDTGCGMTPEFLEHIFEPFTRFENSTTNKVQGTGLGMAITKKIVDLAGGSISVESEVNKGSCFVVEIPLLIDLNTKIDVSINKLLLYTDDDVLIDNVKAALLKTNIHLLVANSKEKLNKLATDDTDVVIIGTDKEVDGLTKLNEKTLVFKCINYKDQNKSNDVLENKIVSGILVRPFFLSDLVKAIDYATSNVPKCDSEINTSLKGKHFLCAEDNALNAEILEALLDMSGASCLICHDGQEIVEAFKNVKPGDYDAILMDVQMPRMNGLEATKAIRNGNNPLGKRIPIVAMTANAFSEDVQHCIDAGMNAHISKPLDMDLLEKTLHDVCDNTMI